MIEVADSNAVYYYHFDALGSVVALSDSSGDTVQTYQYSIYGELNGVENLMGSALSIVIYFLAFFSSLVYSLPLWPGLYESNMKVQCTT